ncbi:hypothetical protein DTO96_102395 [Ephemeroptericola cinctiostellae]|uniref:Phage tail protein E n=1 Tax=Ephemeroptericola cinctiostellae TaxID=2268024 RepID=A0A345DE52_9BURK|nr:phage tail assembly protein [Ephemeroptericola cinctiostellae]AXF86640.1 hypothetical protein DTO96_102395 [Ephemeroptericola cinctiostellae]
MMTSTQAAVVLALDYPVNVGGLSYTEVTVRRPKGRDSIIASKAPGNDIEQAFFMLANLCEVTPEVIAEMDDADIMRINEVLVGFKKQPSTKSA